MVAVLSLAILSSLAIVASAEGYTAGVASPGVYDLSDESSDSPGGIVSVVASPGVYATSPVSSAVTRDGGNSVRTSETTFHETASLRRGRSLVSTADDPAAIAALDDLYRSTGDWANATGWHNQLPPCQRHGVECLATTNDDNTTVLVIVGIHLRRNRLSGKLPQIGRASCRERV